MKKVKIGGSTFNADNIVCLGYATNTEKTKHWVKITLLSKSHNEKGYLQNDAIFIEFANQQECENAIENA